MPRDPILPRRDRSSTQLRPAGYVLSRMRRGSVTIALLLAAFAPAVAEARPGELDRTFSGDGLARVTGPYEESVVADSAIDPQGRSLLLLHGSRVLRVTPAGRLDPTFGTAGAATVPAPGADGNGVPAGIAALPDGGVVVFQGVTLGRFVVARLRPDGTPDPAFGGGDGVVELDPAGYAAPLRGVVVRADGSIRVGAVRSTGRGGWETDGRPPEILLLGLDAAGGADRRFEGDGVVRIPVAQRVLPYRYDLGHVLESPGGSLVVISSVTEGLALRLDAESGVVTFRRDGFFPSSSPDAGVRAASTPDGGVVAWGGSGATLLRLNADFSIDTRFRPRRLPASAGIRPDLLVAGSRVLLAGSAQIDPGKKTYARVTSVVALDDRGKLDRSFGSGGRTLIRLKGRPVGGPSLALDALGRLVVASNFGDGLSSIRDDFGRDDPLMARLRLADPALDVRGTTARVSRRGRIALRLRCRGARTCAATVRVRGGGLSQRRRVRVRSGSRKTLSIAAGRRARSLAGRRRVVTVALRADGRPQDAVDRRVRLRR